MHAHTISALFCIVYTDSEDRAAPLSGTTILDMNATAAHCNNTLYY